MGDQVYCEERYENIRFLSHIRPSKNKDIHVSVWIRKSDSSPCSVGLFRMALLPVSSKSWSPHTHRRTVPSRVVSRKHLLKGITEVWACLCLKKSNLSHFWAWAHPWKNYTLKNTVLILCLVSGQLYLQIFECSTFWRYFTILKVNHFHIAVQKTRCPQLLHAFDMNDISIKNISMTTSLLWWHMITSPVIC